LAATESWKFVFANRVQQYAEFTPTRS
jgi:hypothetical protein